MVQANGVDFDVVERGSGEPPIVFIPGLACDASAWAPQIEDLSRDHRCLAINMRGRGGTPAVGPFDLEQQAADVAAVLEGLSLPPAILVGHSLGGLVALRVNERSPSAVLGIVLGDSPVRERGFDLSRLAGPIREAGSTAPAADLLERFWTEDTPEDVKEQVRAMMLGCPPEVFAGMAESSIPGESLAAAVRLADEKPFMAMWAMAPAGDPSWLREITVFLRQEPVAGAGHFFQLERPAVTNALLRAFLEEAERDPRITH